MADTAFLAEVEDFLTSCDLPTLLVPIEDGNKHTVEGPSRWSICDQASTKRLEASVEDKSGKSYYRRRQMERTRLRQQATELAEELNKRRRASEAIKLRVPSKWRAIAKYQEQERLRAEDKRRRLRSAVDARAAAIQEFQELMQQRLDAIGRVSEEEAQLIECKPHTGPESNMSVVDGGCGCEVRSASAEEDVWRDSGRLGVWRSKNYTFNFHQARLIH